MAYLCGCGMEEVMDPSEETLENLSSANIQLEADVASSQLLEETALEAPGSPRSRCVREALKDYKECKEGCQDLKGKEKNACLKDCKAAKEKAIEDCLHDQGAGG